MLGNDVTELTSSPKLNSPSIASASPPFQAITNTTLSILQQHLTNPYNSYTTAEMARGNVANTKVFYQGSSEGFVVFVESEEIVRKWKDDKTIPLTDVVGGWKIFTTE
jgi:hypothetical protein